MRKKLFIILSLFTLTAQANRKTDDVVIHDIQTQSVVLTIKNGFHFNLEAPMGSTTDASREELKPAHKKADKIVFEFPQRATRATVQFYVCDDKKTVCEPHRERLDLINKKRINEQTEKSSVVLTGPTQTTKTKRLFVFSAPWCPACMRLHQETLNQKKVQQALSKVEIQEINVDLVENEPIKKKYEITAIPVMVLVDEQGGEITRWLDYIPVSAFLNELSRKIQQNKTIERLEKEADVGNETARSEVIQNYFYKMNWEQVVRWGKESNRLEDQRYILAAKINAAAEAYEISEGKAEKQKTAESYKKMLIEAIKTPAGKFDRLRAQVKLYSTQKEMEEKTDSNAVEKTLTELKSLLTDKNKNKIVSEGTGDVVAGVEDCEIKDMILSIYKNLENKEKIKTAQKDLELSAKQIPTKTNSLLVQKSIYFLEADAKSDAEDVLKLLVKNNPTTYVYYQRYATFLLKNKRPQESLDQIEKALKYTEGNKPQLSLVKVKALRDLGRKKETIDLIEQILTETEALKEKYKRTRAALAEIKESLK